MIVGAGDHDNKWFAEGSQEPQRITIYETYAQDARAGIQETHEARATGGAEEVVLTEAQMPEHAHQILWGRVEIQPSSGERVGAGNELKGGHPVRRIQHTASVGNHEPHPNRPPFIALYFCKKT